MTHFTQQLDKIRTTKGFIAALDQSGGSTPKALKLYGVNEDQYGNDEEMFSAVHAMRTRIITNNAFTGQRVLGAILFENTLDREIEGVNSARYLWEEKQIVPFLKVDKGLEEAHNDVQLMKPIGNLTALLTKAKARDTFGTKMRSVIKQANSAGINNVAAQQFDIGKQILAAGLIPIIEPEIDIHSPEKAQAEALLKEQLLKQLDQLESGQQVMLKLTLPEQANFYRECVEHDKVLKVVALSGGYERTEANQRVQANNGMIASFSRALTEGLSAQQNEAAFTDLLDSTIESIYQASCSWVSH